jgi:hypothetical protein
MDGVIRGETIVREAHYLLDGVLTDPSVPRITIRDSLGIAQVTDAIPTRISTGIWQYSYDVPLGAQIGVWTDEWQGTISGQALGPILGYFEVLPVGAIAPVPSSTYTYNLATAVGKVRLLTDDRDMSSVSTSLPLEQRSAVWTDEEIESVLTDVGGSVYGAAANLLRVLASNRSLLVQSRRVGKAELDYGSVRRDLMALAKEYTDAENATPADGLAEMVWDDFTYRRALENTALRNNL